MKKILLIIMGCTLLGACGDFLEEYSQELVYARSCEDLDEILIGNGYMKRNASQDFFYYNETGMYYPYLHVMDDDVEEFITGGLKMNGFSTPAERLRNFYAWGERPFSYMDGTEMRDIDWKRLYQHIGYVNVIISYVKEFEKDPEEIRRRVMGEAQFLRGWYYYMLVNLYAKPYSEKTASMDLGVPLNITEYIEDKYFSRDPVRKVYLQIVADLKAAADNLAGIVQPTFYRVNEAAARTLLSRVYLYMGEWQLAIEECDKIIASGCKLQNMNTMSGQWLNTVDSPEILFTQGSYSMQFLMDNSLISYAAQGGGRYRASDELISLYKKYESEGVVDLRNTAFLEPSSRYCPGFFFVRKSPDLSTKSGLAKVYDACLIRSAEVYLNKAEAQAMLDQSEAINTIKVLMNNRYKDGIIPVIDGLNGKALVDFIREERRRELCLEGHRWFDLRRYGMPSITHDWKVSNGNGGKDMTRYVLQEKDPFYTLPIPEYIMEMNRALTQNPLPAKRTGIQVTE